MGAWGAGSFENDSACDWVMDLCESEDDSIIQEALLFVINTDDYIEVDEASEAIAAAEVVAAIKGFTSESLPEEVSTWIQEHKAADLPSLVSQSLQAINRIETDSELKDLWNGRPVPPTEWIENMSNLKARLDS
jgi:hypothetical protein